MRLAIVGGALLAASCASTTADENQPVARACTVSKCFSTRNIRDFEVINKTTLILYVGQQRCPFKVELRGTFCDMTFAPELNFHKDEIVQRDDITAPALPGETFGSLGRVSTDRICSNDISVSVDGGAFTERPSQPRAKSPGVHGGVDSEGRQIDRFGNVKSECQILGVESMTDDSLIELLVKRGALAPPPPIGQGQIKVGEQDSSEAPANGQAEPEEDANPAAQSEEPKHGGVAAN